MTSAIDWGSSHTHTWSGDIDAHFSEFGGFHPYFAVIGFESKLFFGGYDIDDLSAAIQNAIDSFPDTDVVLVNPVADQNISVAGEVIIDISNVFQSYSGSEIITNVELNSNPDIAFVSIDGNSLTITGSTLTGSTEITIKGSVGDDSALDIFTVKVLDASLVVIFSEDFEEEPISWTYGNTITDWRWGSKEDLGSSNFWSFQDPLSGSKFMGISSDESGGGTIVHGFLISPIINLLDWKNITVSYDYCFKDDGSSSYESIMKFLYRVSENDDWIEIKNYDDIVQKPWITDADIIIPEEAKSVTTQFAIEYDDFGNWAYGGGIDNFILRGVDDSDISSNMISDCKLFQNYPNPFNPETLIEFDLNKKGFIKLVVYNSKGEIVANLISGILNSGKHKVTFNGASLNSGVYYYSLQTVNAKVTKKMLLVK